MKQLLTHRLGVAQKFIRDNHDFNYKLTSRSMSLASDALVENTPSMTDYEFLDCGDLKRLERFGGKNLCQSVKHLCEITAFMTALQFFLKNRLLSL